MLAAGTLSPIEMSAFFHEKLFDPQSSFPDENGFFTYQNSGLIMKYPSDWQKIDPKQQGMIEEQGWIVFGPMGGDATFIVRAQPVEISSGLLEFEEDL
jgi:hypothetical protein